MGAFRFHLALILLLAVIFSGPALAVEQGETGRCTSCHSRDSSQSRLRIDVEAFNQSVHAGLDGCTDCHSQVEIVDGACVHGSGTVNCADCHDQENLHGLSGLEGNRPDCYHCHTRHAILPTDAPGSSVNPNRLAETCANCHPAQSGRVDYLSWLPSLKIATHPKADFSAGDYRDTNCLGCHQGRAAHGETGPINNASCPRCHMAEPGGRPPILGFSHPQADPNQQPGVFIIAIVYQVVILVFLVGGLVFFISKWTGTKPH